MAHQPTKWVSGPGGAKCKCCRIGRKAEAKRLARRSERRAARQNPQE